MNASTCRACLGTIDEPKSSTRLKSNLVNHSTSVKSMFQKVTGYSIGDSEPQNFCKKCSDDLIISFKFKQRCEKTQQVFHNHLKDLKWGVIKLEQCEIIDSDDNDRDYEPPKIELIETIEKLKEESDSHVLIPEVDIHEDCDGDYLPPAPPIPKEIRCFFCNVQLKSKFALRSHVFEQHKEKLTEKCSGCRQMFCPQLFQQHISTCGKYIKHQRVICNFCGEMFSNSHLPKHIKYVHEAPELFTCDLCGLKNIKNKDALQSHMRNLHLPPSWRCVECLVVFKSNSALFRHRRIEHPDKYKLLVCKYCDFKSATHSNLRVHTLSHLGETAKKHKCSFCSMRFHQKHHLTFHEATHSNLRPFECETCQNTYKTRRALTAHKKTHQAHEYECPVCGRSFLTNQMMRTHCVKQHPDYKLPPPGTVMNKSWLKKFAAEGDELIQFGRFGNQRMKFPKTENS